jgi:hypothetical protein
MERADWVIAFSHEGWILTGGGDAVAMLPDWFISDKSFPAVISVE